SVDGQSTYVCVMLLARSIRRAGCADVAAVRRAVANHRYDSPQGPVWVDPETPSRLKWLLDLRPASFLIKPLRPARLYPPPVVAFDGAQRRSDEAAHIEMTAFAPAAWCSLLCCG